jgi:ketosteroid isomerase-like protein
MTPKEFLITYVEKFNAGDISSLINMYEIDACFVSQEGEIIKGIENIRHTLEILIIKHLYDSRCLSHVK